MRLPLAQVDLMVIDQPIVVYPKTDTIDMGNGKTRTFTRPTRDELDDANAWWEKEMEKHKRKLKTKN